MVSERAQKSGTDERLPEVILDFEYSNGRLFIAIENIGAAPAYGVSVKFSREIRGVGGERITSAMNIFKTLEFLPPSKKLRVFLDTFASYDARKQPLRVETTVTYRSKDNRKFSNAIKHDLSIYKDITEA